MIQLHSAPDSSGAVLFAPIAKRRREKPLRFLPFTLIPRDPAFARRLRGRKTFPLPAPFPLNGYQSPANGR